MHHLTTVAIVCECSATCLKVSSPYKCWLPVTNQTSSFLRSIIIFIFLVSLYFMAASLRRTLVLIMHTEHLLYNYFQYMFSLNVLLQKIIILILLSVIRSGPCFLSKCFLISASFNRGLPGLYLLGEKSHLSNCFQHCTVIYCLSSSFTPGKWRMITHQNHFNFLIIIAFFLSGNS